ncbi:MAG: 50S ribosomal protein L4 [bacterium]|nr:50S ribosomal protein L4 [bacterium]
MKLSVISVTKTKVKDKELPSQFDEEVNPNLIKRAVLVVQKNKRQPYGANPRAGKRASANVSKRRHNYRGCYGIGISRVPRKVMSRRGTRFNWTGALVPGTVGGRRAHPPKAKDWSVKINKKERRKAIRSAIAATTVKDLVKVNHRIPTDYPFIIEDKFEKMDKTKSVKDVLEKIGFVQELERAAKKTIRAGKGKTRGRKYKKRVGPLLVISEICPLLKSAKNIAGIDIVVVNKLNAELLAPGAQLGRPTIFTEAAINRIEKEKLFC